MNEFKLCNSFNDGKALLFPSAAKEGTGVHREQSQLVHNTQVCPHGVAHSPFFRLWTSFFSPAYTLCPALNKWVDGFPPSDPRGGCSGHKDMLHFTLRALGSWNSAAMNGFTSNMLLFSPSWLWVWRFGVGLFLEYNWLPSTPTASHSSGFVRSDTVFLQVKGWASWMFFQSYSLCFQNYSV